MHSDYAQIAQRYAGPGHLPVLLREVLQHLAPAAGLRILDATFGRGGYSRALLHAGAQVVALDCDPDAARTAEEIRHPDFTFHSASFDEMEHLFPAESFDAVIFDLGLSTPQLTESGRGFSFMRDEPLDMRADPRRPLTAAQLINEGAPEELIRIFREYGDEPRAKFAVARIIAARPLLTSGALAACIESAFGRRGRTHPATRIFQALRIAVNDELGRLEKGLHGAASRVKIGGKVGVVSFHSGEDRMVKRFFAPPPGVSRYQVQAPEKPHPWSHLRKAVPADDETAHNPASRSARLRSAVRTEAPLCM